jgi:hypothetical protein
MSDFDADIADIAETACGDLAALVIDRLAKARKVNAAHAAQSIPGVCHSHEPTTDLVPGCAYCARRGNAFSGEARTASTVVDDVLKPRLDAIREELRALAKDIVGHMMT